MGAAAPTPETLAILAKLFRGFGDKARLSILLALRGGPRNVSSVVAATGLAQPTVSTQLSCLWCCGLVARRRKGRYVYYRLRNRDTARVLEQALKVVAQVRDHVEACERYDDKRGARGDTALRKVSGWA